jgi:glutathione S-transferase
MAGNMIFHHTPSSRADIVFWMLEELGQPYEMRTVAIGRGEQKSPDYLALNPMGKVPTLEHDGVILTEAAAICCFLADRYPQAGLNVPIDDPRRGPYLKWLFFGPSCVEIAILDKVYKREVPPNGALGYGDYETTVSVLTEAVKTGPYILGDRFTTADVVIGSQIVWGIAIKGLERTPEIGAYADRMMQRPALQRAFARDAELIKAGARG